MGFFLAELEKGVIPSDPSIVRHRPRVKGRRSIDTINTSKMRGSKQGFGEYLKAFFIIDTLILTL